MSNSKYQQAYVFLDVRKTIAMMGDEDSVAPILSMAAQTLAEEVLQIRQLIAQGNTVEAGKILHTVKGSLPIFGSDALVERVTQLERASKAGVAPALVPEFLVVTAQLEQLAAEIGECLA